MTAVGQRVTAPPFHAREGQRREAIVRKIVKRNWSVICIAVVHVEASAMAKMLKCSEVMLGCDAVLYGRNEEEVIGKAEDHARSSHNMTIIPPHVLQDIVEHIRDGEEPRRRWFGLLRS